MAFVLSVLGPLISACASSPEAAKSTTFDSASNKAIVVLSARIQWYPGYKGFGDHLATHWHEYDPTKMRLVPEGETFWTNAWDPARAEHAGYATTLKVMEVDPGDYALIAAGTGRSKSVFVRLKDGRRNATATSYFIEPTRFIDPEAPVSSRKNFLFSVEAGQVVYIGHFRFVMPIPYLSNITNIIYFQDQSAAQAALNDYPGITGKMIPLDLSVQTESAGLYPAAEVAEDG